MNNNVVKVMVTAVTGFLSSILGILYVPVILMVACNVIDYITGLMAARKREDGGISSYKSIQGIQKKVTMWLLVVVGAVLDKLILYSVSTLGLEIGLTYFVACIVAVWIICNEIISILENMVDIGLDMPPFLLPLVKYIRKQAEGKVKIQEEEGTDEEEGRQYD